MEKHKTLLLFRCLQATALLLNNTVFLLRDYQLIVAMQKFDVLKTNVGPPLWHTHFLINPFPLFYGAKGICIFRPLVSDLSALSTSILCHCVSICRSSCLAHLFHLFLEPFLLSWFPCRSEKRTWLVNYTFMQFFWIFTSSF